MESIDDGGTALARDRHEVVSETQKIVEVNDLGPKFLENAPEASPEKLVRPLG